MLSLNTDTLKLVVLLGRCWSEFLGLYRQILPDLITPNSESLNARACLNYYGNRTEPLITASYFGLILFEI
jgi:hypothetical protein